MAKLLAEEPGRLIFLVRAWGTCRHRQELNWFLQLLTSRSLRDDGVGGLYGLQKDSFPVRSWVTCRHRQELNWFLQLLTSRSLRDDGVGGLYGLQKDSFPVRA